MTAQLLPHVPLGGLFGLLEIMAASPGPGDVYRLAGRLHLRLDKLQPLLEAARLLGWAHVEHGDYQLTDEGRRVAAAGVAERKQQFRARIAGLPLIAGILKALAPGAAVSRQAVLDTLASTVPAPEAQRQVDTAVNWGRWAQLFDYDADAGHFLPVTHGRRARS